MSITSGGTLGSVQNKSGSTTLNLPVTAAVPVGACIVLFLAYDNIQAVSGYGGTCIITDAKGNEYYKLVEYTSPGTGAANGATGVTAFCNVRTALASGDNITITFPSSVTAKAASAWRINVGAGNVLLGDGVDSGNYWSDNAPSQGASGAGTNEKLWLWNIAAEGAPTCTTPAGFTAATPQSTSGGQAATNMGVRPFFKIDSLDACDPASTLGANSDWASNFSYVIEVPDPLPRPKADTFIDRFEGTLALWPSGYGGSTIDTGRAKIPCISGWADLMSYRVYPKGATQAWGLDLRSSFMHAKVVPPAVGTGTRELHMRATRNYYESDRLDMYVRGSTLYSQVIRNTKAIPISNVAYNASNHAWWRIRESGGTVYFEVSPNGTTWTQFGVTIPLPFPISQVFFDFLCFYDGTETADFAYIDEFNYIPPPRSIAII